MNHTDVIDAVAEKSGISKVAAAEAVKAIVSTIVSGAQRKGSVTVHGLGKFTRKTRGARMGRNPRTGEAVEIPERRALTFKAPKSVNETM